MQVINPADNTIKKLIGEQKIENVPYKWSTFVIKEGNLLLNTVTGELLDCSEYNRKELINKRYLVPEDNDEIGICKQLRDILGQLSLSKISSYVILPTTLCNARCFYCYENGIKKDSMDYDTAEKVGKYIRNTADERITIIWFGGEPLIGAKQIDIICSEISNINYSSKMISNGMLFSEELVQKAKLEWNLSEVQVTVDGTEEVYNKTKNYLGNVNNPFMRVMHNIQLLIDAEIKVNLRMNLGSHNEYDLIDLINQFDAFKGEYFFPYVHTIFEENSEEMDRKCEQLQLLLEKKGMSKPNRTIPKLKVNGCMADTDSSIVINPSGQIAKCQHYPYESSVGVLNGEIDERNISLWKKKQIFTSCEDCPLLPSCIHLDMCPHAKPCSPFEKANRIEKTKITMRELARKYDEEHK